MLKTAPVNVATTAFNTTQRRLDARAIRVCDLFGQIDRAGTIAHYQSEDCRYQTIISEIRSSPPVHRNQVCRLIPSPVDDNYYISLPNIMDSIEECFSEAIKGTQQGTFAIYGMGGAGKTSLAAHYARTRVDPKRDVLWLHANTEDTLNVSFGEAATALNLEKVYTETPSAKRRDAVRNYLSHLTGKRITKIFQQ